LDGQTLRIEDVVAVAYAQPREFEFGLTPESQRRVARARQAVEDFVARRRVVYGITTGFGAFCNRVIDPEQTAQLQRNIVMSHAVGVGRPLETPVVRAMMLIRANTLAKGHSGCRQAVIDLLLRMLERGVHPVIPRQGSLGASGDLAPLAHMALVLIGLGEAEVNGQILRGGAALAAAGLAPLELQAKEGLALTNGTTLMAALGALAVVEAENVAAVADIAGCLSLEALQAHPRLSTHVCRLCGPILAPSNAQRPCAGCWMVPPSCATCMRPATPATMRASLSRRILTRCAAFLRCTAPAMMP
jgi:histidine ammonia-lyase